MTHALRRQARENQERGGYVCGVGERVCFDGRGNKRRALVIDLDKTELISADDFPDSPADRRNEFGRWSNEPS